MDETILSLGISFPDPDRERLFLSGGERRALKPMNTAASQSMEQKKDLLVRWRTHLLPKCPDRRGWEGVYLPFASLIKAFTIQEKLIAFQIQLSSLFWFKLLIYVWARLHGELAI